MRVAEIHRISRRGQSTRGGSVASGLNEGQHHLIINEQHVTKFYMGSRLGELL